MILANGSMKRAKRDAAWASQAMSLGGHRRDIVLWSKGEKIDAPIGLATPSSWD
jgi:hypothetical protein